MPETGELLQGKVVDGKFHLGRYLGGSERSAVFLTERLRARLERPPSSSFRRTRRLPTFSFPAGS